MIRFKYTAYQSCAQAAMSPLVTKEDIVAMWKLMELMSTLKLKEGFAEAFASRTSTNALVMLFNNPDQSVVGMVMEQVQQWSNIEDITTRLGQYTNIVTEIVMETW